MEAVVRMGNFGALMIPLLSGDHPLTRPRLGLAPHFFSNEPHFSSTRITDGVRVTLSPILSMAKVSWKRPRKRLCSKLFSTRPLDCAPRGKTWPVWRKTACLSRVAKQRHAHLSRCSCSCGGRQCRIGLHGPHGPSPCHSHQGCGHIGEHGCQEEGQVHHHQ
jgi:hypothetical protein